MHEQHTATCANLSTYGCGVVLQEPVPASSPCMVLIPNLGGQTVVVQGTIVRCAIIDERSFAAGIQFQEPIDLGDFVAQDQGDRAEETGA